MPIHPNVGVIIFVRDDRSVFPVGDSRQVALTINHWGRRVGPAPEIARSGLCHTPVKANFRGVVTGMMESRWELSYSGVALALMFKFVSLVLVVNSRKSGKTVDEVDRENRT